ncbi:MAG TPA: nucleotide exchange factor GrpE [Candidatus Paceibacterota bacterium]|nr:nucleotide exchange factor GrpE [Candidatus Paceibacterota bacterium]
MDPKDIPQENTDDVVFDVDAEANDESVLKKAKFRPSASHDESGSQPLVDEIAELKEKNKVLAAEKQQYLDSWQRAQAEFMNVRRREEEERKEFTKYAAEKVIADLLPTLESFSLARSNKDAWDKLDPQWRAGMDSVYNQLVSTLKKHGVEEVDPIGEPFDPSLHEAVTQIPVTDKAQDHTIVQVVQKGYSLNGKPVRIPKVIIGNFEG